MDAVGLIKRITRIPNTPSPNPPFTTTLDFISLMKYV